MYAFWLHWVQNTSKSFNVRLFSLTEVSKSDSDGWQICLSTTKGFEPIDSLDF